MSLRDRVLHSVATVPAPTRKQQRVRTLLVGALFVAAVLVAAALSRRGDRSASQLALALSVNALAIGASTWWLVVPGGALGRSRSVVRVSAATAVAVLVLGAIAGPSANATMSMHIPCFAADLAMGAGFFTVVSFGLRPFDPVAPRATAGALGVIALSWAALTLTLHCSIGDPLHVLATHVLPGLAFVLAGVCLGARWFGVRASKV